MTVSNANNRMDYAGNDVTTVFAYNFRILNQDHIEVILVTSSGVESTKILNSDYTVSGVGDSPGGNVTMTVAPSTGESLILKRRMPFVQETDYVSGDIFPAETHENALDELTMNDLEQNEVLNRCLKAPDQNASILDMPNIANRKNKILTFDGDGNPETSVLTADIANLINNLLVGTEISGYATVIEHQLGSAADGANKFTLANSYTVGNNNILVFRNGQLLRKDSLYDYTETSTTEITLTFDPNDNDVFTFFTGVLAASGSIDAANVTYTAPGAGAPTIQLSNKLGEFISVKDYGAVGDGVTDDSAAVQSAFDYVRDNSQNLHFPAGTYYLPTTIVATSAGGGAEGYRNIEVTCDHEAYFTTDLKSDVIFDLSGQRRFTWSGGWFLKGISFVQDDTTSTAPIAETYFRNVKFAPSSSDQIDNCFKADTSIGVYFDNCQFGSDLAADAIDVAINLNGSSAQQTNINVFRNCIFKGIKTGGVLLDATANQRAVLEFDCCWFESINGYALNANNVTRSAIMKNCYFEALGTASVAPIILNGGARLTMYGGFIAGLQDNPNTFISCVSGGEITTHGGVEFISDGTRQFVTFTTPAGINNLYGVNIFGTGAEAYETLLYGGAQANRQYVNFDVPRITSTLTDTIKTERNDKNTYHNGFIRFQSDTVNIAAQATNYTMCTVNVPNSGQTCRISVDIHQTIQGVGFAGRYSEWLCNWTGSAWNFTSVNDVTSVAGWVITLTGVDANNFTVQLQRSSGGGTNTPAQVAVSIVQASSTRVGNEITVS